MNKFDFSISSYCNAACPACKRYENFGSEIYDPHDNLHPGLNQVHMDFEKFKFIINRDINQFKNADVTFEGELGDPLVNPKVKDFIYFGSEIFNSIRVVTNGGVRSKQFFKKIGDTLENVQFFFSVDGLDDYTNQRYRRKVKTQKAIENMIAHRNTKYGDHNTWWKYIIFAHNLFEIPELFDFAKKHYVYIIFVLNTRAKFVLPNRLISKISDNYEKYKFKKSRLSLGN